MLMHRGLCFIYTAELCLVEDLLSGDIIPEQNDHGGNDLGDHVVNIPEIGEQNHDQLRDAQSDDTDIHGFHVISPYSSWICFFDRRD